MIQIPHGPQNLVCPLHKKYMNKVCHTCPLWVQIRGKDPQSNKELDQWNCSLAWLPILLVENSQMSRQTGAAVESLRNEAVARSIKQIDLSHMRKIEENIPIQITQT